MARMIDVENSTSPAMIHTKAGEVLFSTSSSGQVQTGAESTEFIGHSQTRSLSNDGCVTAPMGGPNCTLFRAYATKQSIITLAFGSPWHTPTFTTVHIIVEP